MTLLHLTAVALLIAVVWIGWREEVLASERQRKNYWRSKFNGANYYLTGQEFPTVSVPVDLGGITISERDVQP